MKRETTAILLFVLAVAGVARADRGPRVCAELEDCAKKCSKGNGEACLVAGFQSDRGEDAGDDGSKSRVFYDKACKKKIARGCVMLARSLQSTGDAKLQKKANAAYKQAVAIYDKQCRKQKNGDACQALAELYGAGQGVVQDAKKATEYMERSCQIKLGGPCPPPPPPPGRPMRPAQPEPAPKE